MKKLFYIIPVVFLAACVHGKNNLNMLGTESMDVKVSSEYDETNRDRSRAVAVYDGELKALRRTAGFFTDSSADQAAVDATLVQGINKFVDDYKILSEDISGGSYNVSLRVWVNTARLVSALKEKNMVEAVHGPRAAVVFTKAPEDVSAFADAFSSVLAGNSVVGCVFLDRAVKAEDDNAVKEAAEAAGAELIIKMALNINQGAGSGNLYSNTVSVVASVSYADSGKLITNISRQGSAVDSSQTVSLKKAMEDAATVLSTELGAKLSRYSSGDPVVRLVIKGVRSFEDVDSLRGDLQKMAFKTVAFGGFKDGTAVFDVTAKKNFDPQELSSAVISGCSSIKLIADGVTARELDFFIF